MAPDQLPRRRYLGALATLGPLAGCGGREQPASGTPTKTESAIPTPSPSPPRTDSPTATDTPTDTPDPTERTFEGGDAAAFADALAWLADDPGRTLRLADGTHRFDASSAPAIEDVRTHFALSGAEDATIDGRGATVVLEDPTRGWLRVADAEGVTVRNLTLDYDPVPFSQGIVRSLSGDATELVVEIQRGFPLLSDRLFERAGRVVAMVHRRDGDHLRAVNGHGGQYKHFSSVEHVGGRRYRLHLVDGEGKAGLATGRMLVFTPRYPTARPLRFYRCREPVVEGVTVRAAPGFALYYNYCASPVARDVTMAPPPGSGRAISTNADGIHVNNCRDGPLVEGCRLVRCSDDPIVVDTQLLAVVDVVDARTVRVRPSAGTLVAAGDRMQAASADFERTGELPPVEAVDVQGGGRRHGPALPERIVYEESVDDTLAPGDLLTDRAFENRGFAVRNNVVRDVHARMIRVGGGAGGTVAGNDLAGSNNDGILVEANAGGSPKRWVDGLTVRNNVLRDVGLVSITAGRPEGIVVNVENGPVHARDRDADLGGRPHRNVRIENNRVEAIATTGIHFADARNGTLTANRVVDPGRVRMTDLDPYGFGVDHAADVAVTGNRVVGTGDDVAGFGWRVASTGVRTAKNVVRVAGDRQPAELRRLDGD